MEWAATLAVVVVCLGIIVWALWSPMDEEPDDDPYEGAFDDEDDL